jgi:hypothetical protein
MFLLHPLKKRFAFTQQRRNALFRGTTLLAGLLCSSGHLMRCIGRGPPFPEAPERAAFPSASALAPAGRLSEAPEKRSPSLPNN